MGMTSNDDHPREKSQLKLHWLTEDSLELEYPGNGLKTNIWLNPTSNIQDELTPCLFTGEHNI